MGGELTCEQDNAPTRLTCTQCATPICPRCLVRTPVGLKCPTCGTRREAPSASRPARRWLVPVVVAVVLAAVIGLPRLLSDPSPQEEGPVRVGPEGRARFAVLGEEALDGNARFVVTEFECGPTEVGSGAVLRRAQGRYCFLGVTVRNVGREPVNLVGSAQVLLDGQGRRHAADERATAAHEANAGRDPAASVINPSNELRSVFVFDLPPDVDPLYANLRAAPGGPGATVRLTPPP